MSEHMGAEIALGGEIPIALVSELCQAIRAQGVALEWGEPFFEPHTAEDLLGACTEEPGGARVLRLRDDEALWGEFQALECFLREHEIAYSRQSDGRYEFEPERVEFRPGEPLWLQVTNTSGEPVIAVSCLAEADRALGQALATAREGFSPTALASFEAAYRLFRDRLPPEVPPLEPLVIVSAPAPEPAHG
jgi:hypothetical protein